MAEEFINTVLLSRLQFAYTALFHILWPVLIVGLSIFLVILEVLWLKTKDVTWYHHSRFWTKLLLLNIAIGVVTGMPMEFQFGTNWSRFSRAGGDIFGHLLGFEATIAFMLEASFLSIMIFGRHRVSRGMYLVSTIMVAFGASLSVFWIMDANAWMQTPAGGYFDGHRFRVVSNWEAIFNPNMVWAVLHKETACLMITIFVVGGISAWYLRKGRHVAFFLKSFKMAAAAAILIIPLQIYLGDGSGRNVFEHQPTKLAGMEAHWNTNPPGEGAPWHVVAWPDPDRQKNLFEINIPYGLSVITTRELKGTVPGLKDFPRDLQPPIWLPFYGFRIMIAVGFGSFFLMLYTLRAWFKGRLTAERIGLQRKLLLAWILAIPFNYLALEAGWVTREVGRQPWVIYNILQTGTGVSPVTGPMVGTSLIVFLVIYTLLFDLFLFFGWYTIRKGPSFDPPPKRKKVPAHRKKPRKT